MSPGKMHKVVHLNACCDKVGQKSWIAPRVLSQLGVPGTVILSSHEAEIDEVTVQGVDGFKGPAGCLESNSYTSNSNCRLLY